MYRHNFSLHQVEPINCLICGARNPPHRHQCTQCDAKLDFIPVEYKDRSSREPLLEPDSMIGNYRVMEVVGFGGVGAVYRAQHVMLRHSVALKVHESFHSDENARYAFYQAANYLSQLNHSNIVSFRDYGFQKIIPPAGRKYEGAQVAYIVMEFVDGQSLFDKVTSLSDGRERASAALKYLRQILPAVRYAHTCRFVDLDGTEKRGVFHGDIKPANILVNKGETAKLTDFMVPDVQRVLGRVGFSQFPGVRDKRPATAAFGTPGYMAPEQAFGGIVTARTDVFGLGVTLYETLTNQLPYEDDWALMRGVAVKRPSSLNPYIPQWLDDLTLRAIRPNPKERIGSVAEFEAEFVRNAPAEHVDVTQPQNLPSRRTDLEQRIRESYQLICEYQDVVQTSDRPEEKLRSQRHMDTQWQHIKTWLDEYLSLSHRLSLAIPSDIGEIAVYFPEFAEFDWKLMQDR